MHRALALAFHSLLILLLLIITLCDARPALSPRQQLSPVPVSPTGQPPDLPSSNTTTNDPTQSFTDGGGTGFNPPAILWIVFASLLGLPLAFAGVRGWRLTSGIGLGLTLSFFIWSAFVNTTTGTSLAANPVTSDLLLSLFVCGIFLLGVAFGALRIGILAGVSSLGASGGAALGILLALLRPGLLIPIYALNIIPIGLFGIAGAAWPIWHQRLAVIVSSSACGSFLIGLAVDLILNKQSGMSQGIRFLLDRNSVHLTATLEAGYKPSLSTWIIVGVSIGLIPVFSYLQHRIFREPFDRSPESLEAYKRLVNGTPVLGPGDEGYVPPSKPGEDDKFTVAPQHIRMRFPSIIPSLPGRVDPRYTAQQEAMRREKEAMEAASGHPTPGPGIGRMNFVPGWNVAVTAVKRMSTSFANGASGAARRMSTSFANGATGAARRLSTNFASGAARRMSTTLGFGFGNGGLRAPAADERRASTLSVPSIYSVASRQNGYTAASGAGGTAGAASAGGATNGPGPTSRLQYDNTRAYTGTQLVPIRPLQLPNRQFTTPAPTRNPAPPQSLYSPSSYAPSTRSGASAPRTPAPAPAPVASLRSNRTGWGANGLPPTRGVPNTPNTPNRSTPNTPNRSTPNTPNRSTPNTPNRSELAYYAGTPATPRSAASSGNNGNAPKETGRNRLKTTTRYNLL